MTNRDRLDNDTITERKQPNPATLTGKLVVYERPDVIERRHERALKHGHSLGAEVRSLLREGLSAEVER